MLICLFSLLRKDKEMWQFRITEMSENTQNTVFSFIFTYLHHTKRCDFVQWQPLFFPWLQEKLFIEKK